MTTPKYAPTWNITTIGVAVNLVILIFMGGGSYFQLRSETHALREADLRLEAADTQIRIDANAQEARLRTVEQGASRMETQMGALERAMQTGFSGLQASLDRLTSQIDRLVEDRP